MTITDLNIADLRCLFIMNFFMKKYGLSAEQSSGFAGCMAYTTSGTFGLDDNEMKFGIYKWYSNIPVRLGISTANFNSMTLAMQLKAFCSEMEDENEIAINELENINDTRSSAIIVYYTEFYPDRNKLYSSMNNASSLSDSDILNVIGWTNGAYSLFYECKSLNVNLTYGNDTIATSDSITKGDETGTYQGDVSDSSFYWNTIKSSASGLDTDVSVKYQDSDLSDITFYNSDGTTMTNPYA